jgi:hypothetical protein
MATALAPSSTSVISALPPPPLYQVPEGVRALGAQIEQGDIEGARFTIAYLPKPLAASQSLSTPSSSSSSITKEVINILIYCHGFRPIGIPLLPSLDLDTNDSMMIPSLLTDGWIVSATSYRREGYILGDAVDDVRRLRQHIVDQLPIYRPHYRVDGVDLKDMTIRVIVMGTSMGGAIGAFIAERLMGLVQGCFLVGAALFIRDDPPPPSIPIRFAHTPKMPVLYLW